jgi:YVTN family beta-propeller protein
VASSLAGVTGGEALRHFRRCQAALVASLTICVLMPITLGSCSIAADNARVASPSAGSTSQGASAGPEDSAFLGRHRATTPGGPSTSATTQIMPYAYTGAGSLSSEARHAKALVYVPNQLSSSVQVIDPRRYKVVKTLHVGTSPEHVVPSHDLTRLWVNSDASNTLTPINPRTGRPGRAVKVPDPYNLYFTPDGRYALVMAHRLRRIEVRDAHTMSLRRSLQVPCDGLNHGDFTADLKLFVVSCEFGGNLVVVDADATKILKVINLNAVHTKGASKSMSGPRSMRRQGVTAMPQDVRLAPDGRQILVADMLRNGVWVIDANTWRYVRFIHTGRGAHSVYPSRDGHRMYVSNRDQGTVSVLDGLTLAQLAVWHIPGGGSPDMGGVSADGGQLWLSGRYHSVVYVLSTTTGRLVHRIRVRPGPHGLLVWPQPGRFSLGHTGNMR